MNKMTNKKRLMLAAALGTVVAIPSAAFGDDNEFGSHSKYYEDDAWYDVTEWFDGNDYNPTDEAIGRWDDEQFTRADNATSSDQDNDWNAYADYGYRTNSKSDWFYDYYDDGSGFWSQSTYQSYYDIDDDGLYDSLATYRDTDGDGIYEDFSYSVFDANADGATLSRSERQARNQQKALSSQPTTVSGTVEKTKIAEVRDRAHLIAHLKQDDGQESIIDLGAARADLQLFNGDQLSAKGNEVKIGDKQVLIAHEASMKAGSITIDRDGRKFQGKVEKTKTVKVGDSDHLLAKINTKNGKTMMVDLGSAKKLESKLSEGDQVTVQGVPVKIKDRIVLMGRKLTRNGREHKIDRQTNQYSS